MESLKATIMRRDGLTASEATKQIADVVRSANLRNVNFNIGGTLCASFRSFNLSGV